MEMKVRKELLGKRQSKEV